MAPGTPTSKASIPERGPSHRKEPPHSFVPCPLTRETRDRRGPGLSLSSAISAALSAHGQLRGSGRDERGPGFERVA